MSIATTDLNLFKAADALLLELSVTRAAERCGVTQQAMSGQLKRLRELFDDELLVQRGRQLGPTPLGVALIQPIRDALIQVERVLVTSPTFDPGTTRRNFDVSSLTYAGATLVPYLVAHLQGAAPHAVVTLKPLEPRFVVDLAESRFDLCLLNSRWRENQGSLPAEVRTQPLYSDTWVVIGDRSRFPGSSISLDAYAAAHHVVVDLGSGGLTSVQKAWIRHRISPHAACVKRSFSDILFMLPGTGLLGTVQRQLARLWAPQLGLSVFPSPIEIDPVDVEMMWHERDDDDPAHGFLRDSLVKATSALMATRSVDGCTAPRGGADP